MLSPKRTKFRKHFKVVFTALAKGRHDLEFRRLRPQELEPDGPERASRSMRRARHQPVR